MIKIGEDSSSSEDSQYEYFIDAGQRYFWVKVKDLETFNEDYKSEIDAFLEEYGFEAYVFPRDSSCNYAASPEIPEVLF